MSKKITVFGASGNVGRLVVSEALLRGYFVTAFVHHHANLDEHPNLHIVQGDIHNRADIDAAITDSQAVISALGSWHTKEKDILSKATTHIVPAMKAAGVDRIITLTGADARARGDDKDIIHRLSHAAISVFAGKILRDGENHIAILEKSDLDWTVVRSPIMTSSRSESYTLSAKRPKPWRTVSRRSVANALLNQLGEKRLSQEAPFIT